MEEADGKSIDPYPSFKVKDGVTLGAAPDGLKVIAIDEFKLLPDLQQAIVAEWARRNKIGLLLIGDKLQNSYEVTTTTIDGAKQSVASIMP